MAMAGDSASEVPVFTETSMGTRIALSAPPDITAADFKRTFEREYCGCFPESGAIRVHGLMVKRRSCFYHLPDSMPIKYVFHGATEAWFLYVNLRPSDGLSGPHLHDHVATKDHLQTSQSSFTSTKNSKDEIWDRSLKPCPPKSRGIVHHSKEKKRKSSSFESCHLNKNEENENGAPASADVFVEPAAGGNPQSMDESSGPSSSEVISVGGIIKRYFSSIEVNDGVTSPISKSIAVHSWANERTNASAEFAVKTPPRPLNTLKDRRERSRVGKRLVTASHVLGVSPSQKTMSSLCRSQNGKVSGCSPGIKCLAFEMSDSSADQSNS
ncbi:uncharacterized protein LOC116190336 isoform X1 [Punica granatum]|uniref:Uncharacterized protein n=2 Tax=Punica granatum TaxID=22663 RepID=A0A2I0HXS5_PUNGR|nr:uncharacterized protein LOC116190336 isoform X1 [Punica granatum]PKI36507.1 hypothetical protein CRG98_043103 [Punica granatum]